MLPDIDGFEVCRRLRSRADVPIILLATKDREEDVVQGFELGADDYITKPFSHRTLMARIDALLRRTRTLPSAQMPGLRRQRDLSFDFDQRQVRLRGRNLDLTDREYCILEELARNAGRVVSHRRLLDRVWGEENRDGPQCLKTYISRLRRKIEVEPRHPQYILTHYGGGYRLAVHADGAGSDMAGDAAGAPEVVANRKPANGGPIESFLRLLGRIPGLARQTGGTRMVRRPARRFPGPPRRESDRQEVS
jgi:two-component system KDP operon response regulator KdpE